MLKRYQRYTKNGIEWTPWFEVPDDVDKEKWQLKGKLLNEYKDETDEETVD